MKNAVMAESATDTAMMMHIAAGDPSELMASSAEEIMPLPYWSEPISAAAEPVTSSGTCASAAALEQAAMMPFMLKTRSIGTAMPQRPSVPVMPSASSQREKTAAAEVAAFSSAAREKRLTSARLSELTAATPMILTPKSSP